MPLHRFMLAHGVMAQQFTEGADRARRPGHFWFLRACHLPPLRHTGV
jgi:hypothetical protein